MGYKFYILSAIVTCFCWSIFSNAPDLWAKDNSISMMPELCDNAIDDDMDGLIDLNDPDCDCNGDFEYYIPNPSFEDTVCCPCVVAPSGCVGQPGLIQCIPPWINSNPQGIDFFHECSNYENRGINSTVPLPAPDGFGFSGQFTRGNSSGQVYKEYNIACLNNTMMSGESFELALSVGFTSQLNERVEISLFGTGDCSNSDYDGGDNFFGCPANNPIWVELVTFDMAGNFEWVTDTMSFISPMNIEMIAFGASCAEDLLFVGDDYHLVDRLELVETSDRSIVINIQGADVCAGLADLNIAPNPDPSSTYQWYRDGIALVGETTTSFSLPPGDPNGDYQILVSNQRGCFLSDSYTFLQEPIENYITTTICEGEFYQLGTRMIMVAGLDTATLVSAFGCDSIVYLDLSITPIIRTDNPQSICQGEFIQVGFMNYSNPGIYIDTLMSEAGCDSIVTTDLEVRRHGVAEMEETICQGDSIMVANRNYSATGTYFDTIQAFNGCDSLIMLILNVEPAYDITEDYVICPGGVLDIHGEMITQAGDYLYELLSEYGCDSTINVHVEIARNPVMLPLEHSAILGEELIISPQVNLGLLDTLFWIPSPTFEITNIAEINQIILAYETGFIYMQSVDTFGCVWEDRTLIKVTKPYNIFIPNAFTPNFDGTNDYFRPYPGSDVQQIQNFTILNRWGDVVYQVNSISQEMMSDQDGWDGTQSGNEQNAGVFMYMIRAEFIDGEVRDFSGDLTLLR